MVKRGYTAALINQTKEKTPAGGTRASFKLNSDALARRKMPMQITHTLCFFEHVLLGLTAPWRVKVHKNLSF